MGTANSIDRLSVKLKSRAKRSGALPWRCSELWQAPLHAFPLRDQIVEQFLPVHPKLDILEVGPGSGYTAFRLASAVHRVTVLDVSRDALARLSHEFGSVPNIDCISADAAEPGLAARVSERYDVVLGLDVFEYIANPAGFFSNAAHLLRPEGRLFLTYPNVAPPKRDGVTHFVRRSDLERLLQDAGFTAWRISTLRLRFLASLLYGALYDWPLRLFRKTRLSFDKVHRPQQYDGAWIFRYNSKLDRYKLAIHLYCAGVAGLMAMGGKSYHAKPAAEDILEQRLLVEARK